MRPSDSPLRHRRPALSVKACPNSMTASAQLADAALSGRHEDQSMRRTVQTGEAKVINQLINRFRNADRDKIKL